MKALIGFDLKRYARQPRTWVLLGLMFVVSLVYLNSCLRERYSHDGVLEGKMLESLGNDLLLSNSELKDTLPDTVDSLRILKDTGTRARVEIYNHNSKEFNRLITLGYLLLTKERSETHRLRELAFEHVCKDMWDAVAKGIDIKSITFEGVNTSFDQKDYYILLMRAKYNYYLYQNNLEPVNESFIDSSTFPYHYMNKVLPWIMGLVITMLLFDCISSERSNDTLKLLLTQPISRSKYVIAKIITGFIHSSFILISPMVIITFVYGLIDSFRNYIYPVLYLKHGFQTLTPIDNYLEFDKIKFGYNHSIGLNLYSGIPKGSISISPKIGLLPLYQFLLLGFIIVAFYILFMVILNVFLSSLVRNKFIGFILSFLIIAGGLFVSNRLFSINDKNISPFTMNNAIRIMSGTYNVTALGAVVILVVSSLILFISTMLIFRKRNL